MDYSKAKTVNWSEIMISLDSFCVFVNIRLWVWPSVRYSEVDCITVGDWGAKTCPLYGIERCPLFRGCFTIGVYGDTIRTWESVRYKGGVRSSEVSVKRGSTVFEFRGVNCCLVG